MESYAALNGFGNLSKRFLRCPGRRFDSIDSFLAMGDLETLALNLA